MGDLKPSEMVAEACRDGDWQTDARARRLRDYSQVPEEVAQLMTKVDAIIRYLDECHEAAAGLPQAAADEAAIDELMAKRAAGLRETPMRGQPQAPADGGEGCGTSDWRVPADEHAACKEQVAALTAERDQWKRDFWTINGTLNSVTAERDELARRLESLKEERPNWED